MGNIELLANALDYVETHIQDDIHSEDIADACFCSKSSIEKLFRNVSHISIRDYVIRRRMTKAAKILVESPEISILDIAISLGYNSNEAFTRAFQQVYNCTPSRFREQKKNLELFPRMYVPLENGDEYMSGRRNFDISELYDLLKVRKDCYFVCCDIKCLIPINEISHKAGDLAILESMKRMEDAAGEDDIVFRIGGDEFVMLTNSEDEAYAKEIAKKITAKNNETFDYEGQAIPLSLYACTTKWGVRNVKYDELFTKLHSELQNYKTAE